MKQRKANIDKTDILPAFVQRVIILEVESVDQQSPRENVESVRQR